jgi:hypothetical protein
MLGLPPGSRSADARRVPALVHPDDRQAFAEAQARLLGT